MILISVILPTYNPNRARLEETIHALKHQSLILQLWELIIIDNNSSFKVEQNLDWHPNARIVKEQKAGLTNARLTGFNLANGKFIVMVDDDNLLCEDYLEQVLDIFDQDETLGAIGGKSFPRFDSAPPKWLEEFYPSLALRDLGNEILKADWENCYPACAPIGAGMAIKKIALTPYINKKHLLTDRIGRQLSSGGDNDIVLEILKYGYKVGYYPNLVLTHIIPLERTSKAYIARLIHDSNCSWIRLLTSHQINPWQKISVWTLHLRYLKAWFTYQGWKGAQHFIRWRGACGTYKGLSL